MDTPVFSRAAIAAPHQAASDAGLAILAEGGNAIEAMVAMAATIAVVYPHMNGVGGDGFWLIREPKGRVRYIEACGGAGALATIRRYRDKGHDVLPARGPEAALTVPGAVSGWAAALDLSKALGGKLPLDRLLGDALKQAREGCKVSPCEARTAPFEFAALKEAPGFAQTFLKEGKVMEAGTLRMQPALAATFDHLIHAGLDDFYRGDVAREMAADLERIGSPVTRDDLKKHDAKWREPLSLKINGATIHNSPPPTQGLCALAILGLYDRMKIARAESFEHVHGLVEASKRALALRDRFITDPAFMEADPREILSDASLAREHALIDMSRAARLPIREADGGTVWMGAIDESGLAVSYIQSIYWEWGSGCVLPRTGVLMQNRGLSFSLDERALNPLSPGRKPFHTLNPPLAVFDDGRVMSYGSMGGDGQPQFQAQILTRVLLGVPLAEAVDMPRFLFGRTWGTPSPMLKMEDRYDPSLIRAMERAGHEITFAPEPYSDGLGHAGGLIRHRKGHVEATHDPRSDGGPAGF